jgi:hypothetical protein
MKKAQYGLQVSHWHKFEWSKRTRGKCQPIGCQLEFLSGKILFPWLTYHGRKQRCWWETGEKQPFSSGDNALKRVER